MSELLIVAVAVFGFAMVSERFSMSPITAPMVFTTIGIVVGTGGVGWFDLDLGGEAVSILVEATLVLVLFTDAIRIDLRVLRRQAAIPGRLLGIGLPLTILAGTGMAMVVMPDLGVAEAALLAAVLAPTDAALGQAVVSDRRPARSASGWRPGWRPERSGAGSLILGQRLERSRGYIASWRRSPSLLLRSVWLVC